MPASLQLQRYHALDALIASTMLLGLALHSAPSDTSRPLVTAWPYHDPLPGQWFDLVVFSVQLFRMPVLFVVTSLFGALLNGRRYPRARPRAEVSPLPP